MYISCARNVYINNMYSHRSTSLSLCVHVRVHVSISISCKYTAACAPRNPRSSRSVSLNPTAEARKLAHDGPATQTSRIWVQDIPSPCRNFPAFTVTRYKHLLH